MKNPKLETNLESTYTAEFFAQHDSTFYLELAGSILDVCGDKVESTLDVGCGHGFLVEAMRKRGKDANGLEGSSSAQTLWPKDSLHKYLVRDLTRLEDFNEVVPCDLVTSFEVAEHIDHSFADHFVKILTCHQPRYVVFGAATHFQDLDKNPTHVNEQPFDYWIDKFNAQGYSLHIPKTVTLKESLFEKKRSHGIKWWYPKNAMVFVPDVLIQENEEYDRVLASIDVAALNWRVRTKNPVFNLMADRDRSEYLAIVSRGVINALRRQAS